MDIFEAAKQEIKDKGYNVYNLCSYTDEGLRCDAIQPSAQLHHCYSVTKSVTAMGVGICIDRGILSLDDRIYPEFEAFFKPDHSKQWEDITVKNLLQHRTAGSSEGHFYRHIDHPEEPFDGDILEDVFDQTLTGTPGVEMVYGDHNYYILSRLIEKKTGRLPEDFLRDELFNPLGFFMPAWARDPQGHNYGGDGLCLRTQDLARLGWLYVNKGVFNGKRILSEDWVNRACDAVTVDENGAYGFAVLQTKCMTKDERYFAGSGDQFVLMCPSKRTVFAFHSLGAGGPFGLLEFLREKVME